MEPIEYGTTRVRWWNRILVVVGATGTLVAVTGMAPATIVPLWVWLLFPCVQVLPVFIPGQTRFYVACFSAGLLTALLDLAVLAPFFFLLLPGCIAVSLAGAAEFSSRGRSKVISSVVGFVFGLGSLAFWGYLEIVRIGPS